MPDKQLQSVRLAATADLVGTELPEVELEVRHGGRSSVYPISHVDFLIGTVPGCDLRVPGADLPPVLCILARNPGGLTLRKLAPTQILLVNGETATQSNLVDGDCVTIGAMDLFVRLKPGIAKPVAAGSSDDLQKQVKQFRAQVLRFQEERQAFEELREREQRQGEERRTELDSRQCDLGQRVDAPATAYPTTGDLEAKAADLEKQRQELATMRQELADIRRQLYERYQERRDRLAGLQTAIDKAASKVQERKRHLDAEEQQARQRRQDEVGRRAELDKRAAALDEQKTRLGEERRLLRDSQAEVAADLDAKLADLKTREDKLIVERRDFESKLPQYQADLLRLDRRQGDIEDREKKLADQSREFEDKLAQLRKDSDDLQEQATELDSWRTGLEEQAAKLAKAKEEQDVVEANLAQRAATVEGQQATLAALRSRLERTREELRGREQHIDRERARQEEIRAELEGKTRTLQQLRAELDGEQQLREQEHRQLTERSAVLDAAVLQLRQAQEKLAGQEKERHDRGLELDRRGAALAEQEGVMEGRLQQLSEAQQRLDLERQTLRERTQALTQNELAREALQEQLRKRSEELTIRQKTLNEKMQEYEAQSAGIEARRAAIERQAQETQAQLEAMCLEQSREAEALQTRQEELAKREARHQEQFEQLQNLGRDIAGERKALADERSSTRQGQEAWLAAKEQQKSAFEALRQEAIGLVRQLPDVELRAGTALERLTHAREQLRDHLAELHVYVQDCRDDLENARGRLQQEEARLQDQEQALRRSQEEHRLAMGAFRQQMIGWQGQIVDLRRLLAKDETRLERRQALVEEQAKEVDVASEELAHKAAALKHERYEVAGKRQEVDRHLVDMREWYRHKLRELARTEDLAPVDENADIINDEARLLPIDEDGGAGPAGEVPIIPTSRDILSLTGPADPGDKNLGKILTDLELIDEPTLSALFVEARRQRRTLRQVLLASGVVTLYQLSLLEAGNVAGLMLGPVRVIDRLRIARHEMVYRVFDPRRGFEAVLRHLAEEDMLDAVRPDEFRQRFTQAMIDHPHIAATFEVLDIAGRPAVLQEWLAGLPSGDWPPLAAAPGVCFRLLTQSALGLDTLHKAGLVHGNLDEASLFLTREGILKIAGAGEPAWLRSTPTAEDAADVQADLEALGKIVSGWCTPTGVRKGPKTKPLPDGLVAILYRLTPDSPSRYTSAADLLMDLDQAGTTVPPNAEAWERLLRHVREHAAPEAALRRSA